MVEVIVAVAIVALAAAVVVPAMNNLTRADLRKSASMMTAIVRQNYDMAALSGTTYRLVFSFGAKGQVIKSQSTSEALHFDDKSGAFVTAAKLEKEKYEQDRSADEAERAAAKSANSNDDKDADAGPSALSALFGVNKLARKAASEADLFTDGTTYHLSSSVHILDVWTDGMDRVTSEGEVYLYFFPTGYTQDALIHLEDSDNRVFTVKVQPLTGKASVIASYVEVPK